MNASTLQSVLRDIEDQIAKLKWQKKFTSIFSATKQKTLEDLENQRCDILDELNTIPTPPEVSFWI